MFYQKLSLYYDIWTDDGVIQQHIHTVSWHWPQAPPTLVGCTLHLFVRLREHLKWHALVQFIYNLSSSFWSPCMVSCMHVRDRGRACILVILVWLCMGSWLFHIILTQNGFDQWFSTAFSSGSRLSVTLYRPIHL